MQPRRMPAEFREAVDAVLMAWPDASTDWEERVGGGPGLHAAHLPRHRVCAGSDDFCRASSCHRGDLRGTGLRNDQIIIVEQDGGGYLVPSWPHHPLRTRRSSRHCWIAVLMAGGSNFAIDIAQPVGSRRIFRLAAAHSAADTRGGLH